MLFSDKLKENKLSTVNYKVYLEVAANLRCFEYNEELGSYRADERDTETPLLRAIWDCLPYISAGIINEKVDKLIELVNKQDRMVGDEDRGLSKYSIKNKFFDIFMKNLFFDIYKDYYQEINDTRKDTGNMNFKFSPSELEVYFDENGMIQKHLTELKELVSDVMTESFGDNLYLTYMRTATAKAMIRVMLVKFDANMMRSDGLQLGLAAEADFVDFLRYKELHNSVSEISREGYTMLQYMGSSYRFFLLSWAKKARTSYVHKSNIINIKSGDEEAQVTTDNLYTVDIEKLSEETISYQSVLDNVIAMDQLLFAKKEKTAEYDDKSLEYLKRKRIGNILQNMNSLYHVLLNPNSRAKEGLIVGSKNTSKAKVGEYFKLVDSMDTDSAIRRRMRHRHAIFDFVYKNYNNIKPENISEYYKRFKELGWEGEQLDGQGYSVSQKNFYPLFFSSDVETKEEVREEAFKVVLLGVQSILALEEQLGKWGLTLLNVPNIMFDKNREVTSKYTDLKSFLLYFRTQVFKEGSYTELKDAFNSRPLIYADYDDEKVHRRLIDLEYKRHQESITDEELESIKGRMLIRRADIKKVTPAIVQKVQNEREKLDLTAIKETLNHSEQVLGLNLQGVPSAVGKDGVKGNGERIRAYIQSFITIMGKEVASKNASGNLEVNTFDWNTVEVNSKGAEGLEVVFRERLTSNPKLFKYFVGLVYEMYHPTWKVMMAKGKAQGDYVDKLGILTKLDFESFELYSVKLKEKLGQTRRYYEELGKFSIILSSRKYNAGFIKESNGLLDIEKYKVLEVNVDKLGFKEDMEREELPIDTYIQLYLKKLADTGAKILEDYEGFFNSDDKYFRPASNQFKVEFLVRWYLLKEHVAQTLVPVYNCMAPYIKEEKTEVANIIRDTQFLGDYNKIQWVYKTIERIQDNLSVKDKSVSIFKLTRDRLEQMLSDIGLTRMLFHEDKDFGDTDYYGAVLKMMYLILLTDFNENFIKQMEHIKKYRDVVYESIQMRYNLVRDYSNTFNASDFIEDRKTLIKNITDVIDGKNKGLELTRLTQYTADEKISGIMHNKEISKETGFVRYVGGDYVCKTNNQFVTLLYKSGHLIQIDENLTLEDFKNSFANYEGRQALEGRLSETHYTTMSEEDLKWVR